MQRRILIHWDTSDFDTCVDRQQYMELDAAFEELPEHVDVDANLNDDEIGEWISNEYGWCITGFEDDQLLTLPDAVDRGSLASILSRRRS